MKERIEVCKCTHKDYDHYKGKCYTLKDDGTWCTCCKFRKKEKT